MGELISGAERNALSPSKSAYGAGAKDYAKRTGSRAFKTGYKLAENMVAGRMYVGLRNSGPRMGGNIITGMRNLAFRGLRFGSRVNPIDAINIARVLINTLTEVAGPHYSTALSCSSGADFASGVAYFNNCTSPWVVAKSAMNKSLNARTVCTWKILGDYINPSFMYCQPVNRWTKPLGYSSETVQVTGGVSPRYVPQSALLPVTPPVGSPMSWAPDFSRPATDFPSVDELAYNTGPKTGPGWPVPQPVDWTVPLPGTQVITPTPTPPVVKPGDPPPSNPFKGRGRREVKFGGKKFMLRLLRLSLALGEGVDAVNAITKAIPKERLKKCRKAARERYWRNRESGRYGPGQSNWQMTPQEQAACIYANWDKLDMNHVVYQLIKNQIEDLWAGWQYGAIDSVLKSGRGRGGGYVTKNPYEHVPLSDMPFALPDFDQDKDFWDQVEDYLEQKERNQ